ncbi:AMP-binding protein [Acidimicrobiia bacterium EGI L10123]|uniref:AMP-binding protein n=1 Tax=Salinilacustrithrix flava TaxID=2957203 RepID=UPI003D7C3136|nr:AMP-binding protein [Acidimicrobiia bacterium EGI L10123]
MPGWNFADAWETVAETLPDAPALLHGDLVRSWSDFDARADGVAAALLEAGVTEGTSVAQYLTNRPEYLEAVFAAFKLGLAPVNTNYRYVEDELLYLWDNADSSAVVFEGQFTERIEHIRDRVPDVRVWLWVDDGHGECPDWATPYEAAATSGAGRTSAAWGRSGDSLYLLYTGGTTGMPKGVMWRNDDLLLVLNDGAPRARKLPEDVDLDHLRQVVSSPGIRTLPACPLMHGTGAFNAFTALTVGGSVVTLTKSSFDAVELLDAVQDKQVNNTAIVGDAFARPILAALDAHNSGDGPDRWDISSLKVVVSSGVMWSQATKDGLLRHNPKMLLVDTLGSSEAIGMASSVSSGSGDGASAARTATFTLGPSTKVIADDGTEVHPGDDAIGKIAIQGRTPVGYYKDPAKSAETFVRIGDATYSMPGDYARVEADGTLVLLGRGSVCINTGGEKVFPEEVEEALKEHADVRDAVVVGLPDERFGQAITAVVEVVPGTDPSPDELIATVKAHHAAYKAPKRIVFVDSLSRAANGKVDYKRWTRHAAGVLGADEG